MFGVIVAAGYGTRFLPITKTLPKEMLPLFDKLLIDFVLDEFQEAGINDIIIITSRRKKVLEDYLDREIELENFLSSENKIKLLNSIKPRNFNYIFIRQPEMKGTGHALLLTKNIIKEEPFLVAYPDDIFISNPGVSKELLELYYKTNKNIITVREENNNLSRYGVIEPKIIDDYIFINRIVEKPNLNDAPSNLISLGRYLFKLEFLKLLEENYKYHKKGEYYHIDSINKLAKDEKVLAYKLKGIHLDTGEPYSYIESLLIYLYNNPEGRKIINNFYSRYLK